MPAPYYTLRFVHSDACHRSGERIAARGTVHIGHHPDCEARIENATAYDDQLLAVVRPASDGHGWLLVRMTPDQPVTVNGQPVTLAVRLHDGDRISIGDDAQELVFNIRQDGLAPGEQVAVLPRPFPKGLAYGAMVFVVAIFGLLAWMVNANADRARLYDAALLEAAGSVLQISVDSVWYGHVVDGVFTADSSYSYQRDAGASVSGTAFLTTDSLLVTARHCIDPWLNDNAVDSVWQPASIASLPLRWALLAETYNQTHDGDTVMAVISRCTLFGGDRGTQQLGVYLSTDFLTDDSCDAIVETGDYDHEYYYRSLRRRHNRTDMMRGDFAYLCFPTSGSIRRATADDLDEALTQNVRLDFIGYPAYEEKGCEIQTDRLRLPFDRESMLVHNGSLQHGYSGGPVIVARDGQPLAAGIVSVLDANGNGRAYSVPITVISTKP